MRTLIASILWRSGSLLRRLARIISGQGVWALVGDRDVEWSWIVSHMPLGPGEALDFGCGGGSWLGLVAARRGHLIW